MKGTRKNLYQAVIILITLFAMQFVIAGELESRAIIREQSISAFEKSDFKKLEKIVKYYRSDKVKLDSGLWALTFYYRGLAAYAGWSAQYPDDIWLQEIKRTERWIKKFPGSPTPYIVKAIFMENMAYTYRISDSTAVTPKEMQKSIKLMEDARKFMVKNKLVASKDPHYYVEMIRIATGQQWNEKKYMLLVDEAVKRYPMYYQIYFAAVDYFSPKFGGNIKQMDKFARYAAKHTKNKIGMSMYTRIYWAAIQSWPRKEVWSKINWNDFKSGIDTVLASYPDDWNINNFALFACKAGDKEKALELINKIKNGPIPSVWRSRKNYNQCRKAVGLTVQDQERGERI